MVLLMPRPIRVKGSQHPVARKVVPLELRPIVGKTEFRRALRGTPSDVKRLHSETLAGWERELQAARDKLEGRAVAVSDHDIEAACGDYYRGRTAGIEQQRKIDPVVWSETFSDLVEKHRESSGAVVFEPSQREIAEADELLRGHGIAADRASLERTAERLWVAKVEIARLMERRGEGDWSPDLVGQRYPASPPSARGDTPKVTFQSLAAAWGLNAGHDTEGDHISRPYYERVKTMDRLEAFLGHDDARAVTREEAVRWKSEMLRQKLSAKTVATQISKASAVWTFGMNHEMVSSNPFARLTPTKRGHEVRAGRKRPYTEAEAARLLMAARGETGALRWLPILLYCTGARLSEVAEATKADVMQKDGFWILSVNDKPDSEGRRRSIKNESSIRDIPLHPAVVSEGFMEFVSKLPAGPIFKDVKPDSVFGKRGVAAQKILGRWIRAQGITDEKISPAHSFRHLFIDLARRAGIHREVRDGITGHRTTINEADSYGLGVKSMVALMAEAVAKIPLPIELNRDFQKPDKEKTQ